MRYLVTGAAGFLGSHLCESLLKSGQEVVGLDNYYTGDRRNINQLFEYDNFEMLRQDIVEPINIEVEMIYNLACPASPIHYQRHPVQTIKTSLIGAINVLELAKRNKARVFQASTSEVYGDPSVSPQREDYWGNVNPIGIRSCYDEGKRAAESLFFDYNRQFDVDIRVARIFNTYGPRMAFDDGRVVSNFIVQALNNLDITLYGDGKQSRSFCFVDDLIRGIRLVMDSDDLGISPINLGNPIELNMEELALKVLELTGSNSKLSYEPLPGDDPKMRKPDITKAITRLGWEPKIDLMDGLRRTIQDFEKRMRLES
jgi:UDP-glucuronate decarboxylase